MIRDALLGPPPLIVVSDVPIEREAAAFALGRIRASRRMMALGPLLRHRGMTNRTRIGSSSVDTSRIPFARMRAITIDLYQRSGEDVLPVPPSADTRAMRLHVSGGQGDHAVAFLDAHETGRSAFAGDRLAATRAALRAADVALAHVVSGGVVASASDARDAARIVTGLNRDRCALDDSLSMEKVVVTRLNVPWPGRQCGVGWDRLACCPDEVDHPLALTGIPVVELSVEGGLTVLRQIEILDSSDPIVRMRAMEGDARFREAMTAMGMDDPAHRNSLALARPRYA
jgi:hypothetical protein